MTPFEVKIAVQVELSESTKDFILAIFGAKVPKAPEQISESTTTLKPESTTTTTKAAATTNTKAAATTTTTKAATTSTTTKAATTSTTTKAVATEDNGAEYDAADVRKIMAPLLNDNRAAIKAELTRLGAESVSTLDTAKYADFVRFLKNGCLPF